MTSRGVIFCARVSSSKGPLQWRRNKRTASTGLSTSSASARNHGRTPAAARWKPPPARCAICAWRKSPRWTCGWRTARFWRFAPASRCRSSTKPDAFASFPRKRESIVTARAELYDLWLWVPAFAGTTRSHGARVELAALAEAPEVSRHDRRDRFRHDAERFQRAAVALGVV